jgi:hypothetical protein
MSNGQEGVGWTGTIKDLFSAVRSNTSNSPTPRKASQLRSPGFTCVAVENDYPHIAVPTKTPKSLEKSRVFGIHRHSVLGMLKHVRSIVAGVATPIP